MIDYEYTAINRLITPHKYMYTIYQGSEFLDIYFKNRLANLKRFKEISLQYLPPQQRTTSLTQSV